MVGRLNSWLRVDVADDDLAQRGLLLNILLLLSIVISVSICLFFLGIAIFASQQPIWPALGPPLVVVLVSAVCLWLSKSGRVQIGVVVYVTTLFIAITASVFLFDGFPSNSVVLFFWPIIAAGLLVGPRHALSASLVASLIGVSAAILEESGVYSPPIQTPESAYQLVTLGFNIIVFLSLGLLVYMAVRSSNRALERERVLSRDLQAHHSELKERSAELGLINAELKREVKERQRAEEALQDRVRELDALQQTVLDITAPHDLPSLLETIVVRATSLLDASGGAIYQCDPQQDQVQCVVSYSTQQDYTGTVLAYGEGAAGSVAQTGAPLILDDYGAWSGQAAIYKDSGFHAVVAAPMIWQERVIGVLDIIHDSEDRRFDQGDLDLLGLLANHAAIAIENTRLYERAHTELTERMQAERESNERQLYLEGVLTAAPDAIVTLDSQQRVVEWNRGAERLFEYAPAEAIGQNLDDLVTSPETRQEAEGFTQTVTSGRELLPVETTRRCKDGTTVHVIVAGAPIQIGGHVVGIVVVYTDITERVRTEQELEGYRLHLETRVAERAAEVVQANKDLQIEIAERARAEDRLTQINECFLGFGPDPLENIKRLTALGGQLLGADCALYNRVDAGELQTIGQWNAPAGFEPQGSPEGHICYDVVAKGDDSVLVMRDLLNSAYADTMPSLSAHQLQTYIGTAVRSANTPVGAFCVVYRRDFVPSESDKKLLGILASAVGVEEDRRQAEEALRRYSERLQILYQIGQAILATQSPQSIVEAALERILGLIPCTGGVVVNVLGETRDVEIFIVDNTEDGFALPPGIPLPAAIFAAIENELGSLRRGEVFLLEDFEIASLVPLLAPIFEERDVRTLLVLPLLVQETVMGVIALGTDVPGRFTYEHIEIGREIADLLALAIQQALLREQLQQHAEDLEEQAGELERSNKELQQFAYVASHDLQEPLRMVTSYLQLLEQRYGGQLDSDADEFIGFAVDGATRMHQLIKDLLTYSRVSTHGGQIESTDSHIILGRALSNLQVAIEENNAVVTHDSMPTVMADPSQLSQLLQNLIGNALKFRGDGQPVIHIGAERQDDAWRFSIRDNGIGIEPQFADRIFVIFQRLHTRTEYPGTGIGLAICKRIVERQGGRIWLESVPGQGSIFYFTVPA